MKKLIALMLAAVLCLSIAACGSNSGTTLPKVTEPATVEDLYAELVNYATTGQYLEAWRLTTKNPEVLEYEDAQDYSDYCDAMKAYENGGIGYAYKHLQGVSHILNAQDTLDIIEAKIGGLNGHYVADNGVGSYLHIVIQDGMVAREVIGYHDEEQEFVPTEDDFFYNLVVSKYDDGTEYLAIGRYSSLGADLNADYVIHTFDDTTDLMLINLATNEYNTFNGVYTKIS